MFPQIFGKYMLEREIASGGMARVYLATLRGAGGFEKRLVVKQIRPELASDAGFVERFVKEAKTAVELSHPGIVPVYELGVEQGVYYIAMEHCDGSTLSDLLQRTGPLDPEEGAYLGAEICRALDYAHRRAQIIHRDVTPRNVLIDEEGAVRLIDFGIAAPAAEADEEDRPKAEVFGSPGHMPPEQLAGDPLTPAADVFAVGALLFEAWTGRPAFRRSTAKESRLALQQRPEHVSSADRGLAPLDAVIRRSMSLHAEKRPANAEELAKALRDFLRSHDTADVARRLGQRVREARELESQSGPWRTGEGMTGLDTPSDEPRTPSESSDRVSSAGTRTFAASRNFSEWTRRISSAPPPPLESTPPSPASSQTRRLSSSPPPSAGVEAVPAKRSRMALNALAALLAVAGFWWLKSAPVPPQGAPVARTAPARSVVPNASAVPSESPAPGRSASASEPRAREHVAAPPSPGSSPSPRPHPSASAEAEPPAGTAVLSLTALPGASVTVGGKIYSTPVTGLSLAPGRYQVTFRNATWDAPVSTEIQLGAGGQRRVHADFTHEPPRVIVR